MSRRLSQNQVKTLRGTDENNILDMHEVRICGVIYGWKLHDWMIAQDPNKEESIEYAYVRTAAIPYYNYCDFLSNFLIRAEPRINALPVGTYKTTCKIKGAWSGLTRNVLVNVIASREYRLTRYKMHYNTEKSLVMYEKQRYIGYVDGLLLIPSQTEHELRAFNSVFQSYVSLRGNESPVSGDDLTFCPGREREVRIFHSERDV